VFCRLMGDLFNERAEQGIIRPKGMISLKGSEVIKKGINNILISGDKQCLCLDKIYRFGDR